jgi:hypothetical protein
MGRDTSNQLGDCALLFTGMKDKFGIGIQQGKGVVIEGFRIQGEFDQPYVSGKQFYELSTSDALRRCISLP